jgi:hypothetical protein
MAKHAGKGKGNATAALKATGKGIAVTAVGTAKVVKVTAKATGKTLNFCCHPFCLHDARTAKCSRKCCN